MKHKFISLLLCASMAIGSFAPAVSANEVEVITQDASIVEVEADTNMEQDSVSEPVSVETNSFSEEKNEEMATVNESAEPAEENNADISVSEEDIVIADDGIELSANMPPQDQIDAAAEVSKLIAALPNPEDVTTGDAEQIAEARAALEALSVNATNEYITRNEIRKLEACENQLEKILSDISAGREMTRKINHLPETDKITKENEAEIAQLEAELAALTDDERAQVDPAAIQKLIDARNKIKQIDAIAAVDDYVDTELKPLINNGDYDEEHQKEIDDIIAEAEQKIKDLTESGEPVTQDQIDAIIDEAREKIDQVKTVYELEAEAYEAKIDAYKTPDQVVITDGNDVAQLRADYEALSDRAKTLVNTTILSGTETYYKRLTSLEKKIALLEKELKDAKDVATNEVREFSRSLAFSGEYAEAQKKELFNIAETAIKNINETRVLSSIQGMVDKAKEDMMKVKTIARLDADAYEAKVDNMGPVIDLSRSKADDVKKLREDYNNLSSKARALVDTDKTVAGDTYKERLEALEARIDKMASDDALNMTKIINSLPLIDNIKVSDEGSIVAARTAYEALTKEAKAKVPADILQKLVNAEARLVVEKNKVSYEQKLASFLNNKKANTSYFQDQMNKVNNAYNNGVNNIRNATTTEAAKLAYENAVKAINSVQTKAQRMKAAGTIKNFSQMRFYSSKQTKYTVYFRWSGVSGVDGYQIYGGPKGQPMKMIKQYDYKARSGLNGRLDPKKHYQYKLYAFKVVDGEIIHTHESPLIYVTTKGGKYGNIKKVKVKKVGKKNTSSVRKTINVSLKKGKKAKIKATEKRTKSKIKRFRKLQYESTNPRIANVSSKGKITAVNKGVCYIRVYSQTGTFRTIKVTVK